MARTDYVPKDDAGKCALFIHVRDTLPTFFAALGLANNNSQVLQQGADAAAAGYVDTEPFPAGGAKWRYKAIFRADDARVGLWSDVAEITVG